MLGRDLLPATVDEVLDPPGQRQIPVRVQRAQITGAQPSVDEGVRRAVPVGEIAAGDGRSVHPHLTLHAHRTRPPAPVDDPDLDPGRPPDRPLLQRSPLGQRLAGRLVRGLRHPVRGQQRRAERTFQRALCGRVEGSAATPYELQGRRLRARVLAFRPVEQDLVDGRHRGEPGGGDGPHVVPERARREPPTLGQQHAPSTGQRGQQSREQPMAVEERHHRDGRVGRAQLVGGTDALE